MWKASWSGLASRIVVGGLSALISVACGGSEEDSQTGDDQNVIGDSTPEGAGWAGLYGTESTQFIMALRIKSEEPFVFAISASRQNLKGITVDAHDLKAKFDDASKKSATFKKGDCTLKLKKTETGVDVEQQGACTSIKMPKDMQVDASLNREATNCWDVGEKSFKVPGTCKAAPGFESGPAEPASETKKWVGLYGTESTQFIMALNVKSEEPFVFAISASRQNLRDVTVDAHGLEGKYTDKSKTSVLYEKGPDCAITLKKTESGIDIAQEGSCAALGMNPELSLDGRSLSAETKLCWDVADKSFAVAGSCTASPGF